MNRMFRAASISRHTQHLHPPLKRQPVPDAHPQRSWRAGSQQDQVGVGCQLPLMTLCDPRSFMSDSLQEILQARILEWVAIPFSRGSSPQRSNLGLPYCRQILYHLSHQGSPYGGRREPKPESPPLVYCSASWHVSSPRGGGPTREMGAHYGVILSAGPVDLHIDV